MLVGVIAEELEIDIEGVGSTTFRREDLARGFEPDACYYLTKAEYIRHKDDIDLAVDPPPELVLRSYHEPFAQQISDLGSHGRAGSVALCWHSD